MSHRIATTLAATLAAVALAVPAAAHAGEHSSNRISGQVAHRVATYMARTYLAGWLLDGDARVGRCSSGSPMRHGSPVWHCPLTLTASDARCTADVWVWPRSAEKELYMVEMHRLRCQPV